MFSVLSSLRAAQLVRGCIPRVVVGPHKLITTAQMEVAQEKVERSADLAIAGGSGASELP
jgi:hypothetical protein